MNDLTNIDTSGARLPSTYSAAKRAISQCASIDECKDWSDKAAALASYAKQAQDDQLEKMAARIRARATRRAGELLKQIEPAKNQHDATARAGDGPSSRSEAARNAGLSARQQKQAQRLASIPADDFEEMVESGATVTELADAGTMKKAPNRDEARKLVYVVKHYAERLHEIDVSEAIAGLTLVQASELRMLIARLDAEHDRIVTSI